MENLVEKWLNQNPEWFEAYALKKLDSKVIDKFLDLNGKKICDCKKTPTDNQNSVLNYRQSKIDNLNQSSNILNGNHAKESLKSNYLPENESIKVTSNSNLIPCCSYTCVIHNKRPNNSIYLNKQTSNDGMMLASTEELTSEEEENGKNKETHLKIDNLNIKNSLSNGSINNNQPKASNNHNNKISNILDLNTSLGSSMSNSFFASNNNANKRISLTSMRKYHTMYSCDSATSLNILKYLIESKIKLPTRINDHSFNTVKTKLFTKNDKLDTDFLIDLIQDISYELNLKTLSEKIVNNLKLLVNAQNVSLFFVCHSRKCFASYKHISNEKDSANLTVPNFNSKRSWSLNEDNLTSIFEIEIPFGETLLGKVALTGNLINIPNVKHNPSYNSNMDKLIDYDVKSVLCVPIKNFDNEVIAVVQITNKINEYDKNLTEFNENDIKTLNKYLPFCGVSIVHSQLFDLYEYEYDRNRSLLEVVHDLFEQQTNLDIILFRIMQKAQTLLKCQRCSILLILDNEDQASQTRKAFDLFQSGKKPGQRRHSVEDDDGTKISRNLADYVIMTGNKINLHDAYNDPRFDPLVDTIWKFKTQAILCLPIRNSDNTIIGCAQLANRLDNQPFDENDELLFEAFCIFCGLGIKNTLIYNQLEKSMAEKTVALEVLSYHATCAKSELSTFLNKFSSFKNFSQINKFMKKENLSSFVFDDFCLNNDEMILASYEMFKELGLMKTFKIEKQTLLLWLLTVRKNYRDVEYHNWSHAFNVCQSMFAIFENSKISCYLQDVEKLAMLVGCLCHDLDHRGTNNTFQVESHSALSQLYGTTATMEKHHFNHCIMILNTPGHNVFSNLKPRIYALVISLIKEAILATDLADHFSIKAKFDELILNKEVIWTEEPSCSLLRKHLMTCCDLNSVTKPWNIHKDVVNLVTKEFFAQGDRERLELNIEPQEMMDARRSHELPRLQIGWIDNVCMPLYKNISYLCDSFKGHLIRVEENRRNWSLLNNSSKKNNNSN